MPLFSRNVCPSQTSRNCLFLAIAFLLSLSTASAHAATYYVATGGSDSNPGTEAAPFKTIQKGADVARAGDTVMVLPGTYNEAVKQKNDGTASGRIRLVSQTKWGAKVIGRSSHFVFTSLGDYVDIEGFDVTGDNSAYVGIAVHGSYSRILYNHVHNIRAPNCTSNGGAGIMTPNYASVNKDMIGNVVHDIGTAHLSPSTPYCNFIHGIYHGTRGGKVQNNIVYNTSGAGIHLWHAPTGAIVSHNLSFSNRSVGIVFGCGDKPHIQCDNIMIANNIVMNNKSPAFAIREMGNNTGSRVFNNIVYGNANNTIQMKTGTESGNVIGVNPRLVNFQPSGGGDYHPAAGSPAIDAASSVGAVPNDIDLGARPVGAAADIGPYEVGSTPGTVPLPPPTGGFVPVGIGGGGGVIPGIGNCFH